MTAAPAKYAKRDAVLQWLVPLAIALASFMLSGWVGYEHHNETTTNRLTAVEIRETDADKRLDRIENKLDQVLELERAHR